MTGKTGFRQYRKKPVVIMAREMPAEFEIQTMEGLMKGKAGDFLVIGVKGEKYPVDWEIFRATYEEVNSGG